MEAGSIQALSGQSLIPSGPMDSLGVATMRKDFDAFLTRPGGVTVDLAGVEVMDGAGVGALAFMFKRLVARGDCLQIVGATGQPLLLLRELGLGKILGIDAKR